MLRKALTHAVNGLIEPRIDSGNKVARALAQNGKTFAYVIGWFRVSSCNAIARMFLSVCAGSVTPVLLQGVDQCLPRVAAETARHSTPRILLFQENSRLFPSGQEPVTRSENQARFDRSCSRPTARFCQ